MTGTSSSNISLLINKPVKDELRSEIGKILSFIVDPTGQASKVLIRDNNGEYECYSVDRLTVENDAVVLLSEIDRTVRAVSERVPLLWRKKKVLDKLSNENKILPEIYESLYNEFSEPLEKLKIEAQGAVNELDRQINDCEETFRTLRLAKTYLEIEHEIGRVEEDAYKESLRAILNGLKGLVEKKQRLQEKRDTLSNILLGEELVGDGSKSGKEEVEEARKAELAEGQEGIKKDVLETTGPQLITVHVK